MNPSPFPRPAPGARSGLGRYWPAVLVTIVLSGLSGVGWLIYRATTDKTFAVEPDFYNKALRWDSSAREQAISRQLGWSVAASIVTDETGASTPTLVVRITGGDGAPIRGADVGCEAFAHARAADRRSLRLVERSEGEYAAALENAWPGTWRVRTRVKDASGRVFTAETDTTAPHVAGGAR